MTEAKAKSTKMIKALADLDSKLKIQRSQLSKTVDKPVIEELLSHQREADKTRKLLQTMLTKEKSVSEIKATVIKGATILSAAVTSLGIAKAHCKAGSKKW